jgi:hypothetical protein
MTSANKAGKVASGLYFPVRLDGISRATNSKRRQLMFSNSRHSLVAASVVGLAALAAAFPASAQQNDAQKRNAAFAACHREADSAVPALRSEQDEMNHYLVFSVCLEKRGYALGVNARGNQ